MGSRKVERLMSTMHGFDLHRFNHHSFLNSNDAICKLIITIFSIIFAAMLIGIVLGSISFTKSSSEFHAVHNRLSISLGLGDLIQTVCKNTLYPDVCTQEISNMPLSLTASPLDLISAAVQAAVSTVDDARNLAVKCLSQQGLGVFESQAAGNCIELMDNTKNQVNAVISRLSSVGALDLGSLRDALKDIKAWLSASLSFQTACSDGFDEAPGSIQGTIQNNQDFLAQVIANVLSLVEILAEIGNDVSSWLNPLPPSPAIPHLRRLLTSPDTSDRFKMNSNPTFANFEAVDEDGFPTWISAVDRKLLQVPTSSITANVIVAQDGSGDFRTVTDAVNNIPTGYQGRYVIYIREGEYAEVFNVSSAYQNVTFLGDGIGYTVITGTRNVASGLFNTYRTATVAISASGFLARDITFRNTAGPIGHQAVAVRAAGDLAVFDTCSFEGYQDTLYALSSRQFYRNCQISGTVDFIFGNAIAVFQDCELIAREPLPEQQNTYTAQGRKVSVDISGFSFRNCTVTGEQNLSTTVLNYLGRPWKAYSRVVFIESEMDSLIDPAGWLPWNASNPYTDTIYYGEYMNRGPGSDTTNRVKWAGVHPTMTPDEASQFTVENFISGVTWLSPDYNV